MKVKSNLFSLSANRDSLICAVFGFILIQIFAKHSGIGVSPDSVTYLATARHMLSGQGFKSFDQQPTVDFPIGYPLFLTIISFFTRLDPLKSGSVLNGILFGLVLYTSGALMNGFPKKSGWYKRILLACILMSPALQEVYSLLWSETIFLLLMLFFIISVSKYLDRSERKWLLASAAFCALVCITRYAGVFIVFTGLILIFFNSGLPWRKRIRDCWIFALLALFPLAVNILRNRWLTGLATGPRPGNATGLSVILELFGSVLCDWLGLGRNTFVSVLLVFIVLFIFVVSVFFLVRRRKEGLAIEYVASVTGLLYCLFMLTTAGLTRYETFTNRLLAPMFIPLLWSLSWWIPGTIAAGHDRLKGLGAMLALSLSAWFLNIQLAADYEYYDGVKDAGIPGYQEDEIRLSEMVLYLGSHESVFGSPAVIYSNAGDAVYFFTGLTAHPLPFIEFPDKISRYYSQALPQVGKEWLVWFNDLDNPEMPALGSILQHKNMILVLQLKDGAIYRATE